MMNVCVTVGNDPTDLEVGVVNYDSDCTNYNSSAACPEENLSCQFLDLLPGQNSLNRTLKLVRLNLLNFCTRVRMTNIFNEWHIICRSSLILLLQIPFDTEEEALEQTKAGKTWGFMVFPANYSKNMYDRAISGGEPTEEILNGSIISFEMDMTSGFNIKTRLLVIWLKLFRWVYEFVSDDCLHKVLQLWRLSLSLMRSVVVRVNLL